MGAFDPNLNVVEMEPAIDMTEFEDIPPPVAGQAEEAVAETPAALLPLQPQPLPLPLRLRTVSGSYAGTRSSWRLDLRVDVDGARPMTRISGDYFSVSGATTNYFGSFVVDAPTVTTTSSTVTIRGRARATWSTSFDRLDVTIPRRVILLPPAAATVVWRNAAGSAGASYLCDFVSRHFRTVELEEDAEQGVTPFVAYNTGSLPSGGPARTLSTLTAYTEAGIDLRSAGTRNVIPTAEAGVDARWSNAELHASMVRHFSLWRDDLQWKVWLLHAMRHEYGPSLLGIMFDQQGRQRQGCAGFYQSISGTAPTRQRDQLYVCVHELGHCFNLFHSFHKKYMNPPMPNREWSLSWMNYPQNYRPVPPAPGGSAAFWSAFPFQFDDLELIHLRHGFRNDVIMGGNPFGTGAALTDGDFAEPVEDRSGLTLALEAKASFMLGEPVVIEIKLRATDNRGKRVHRQLNPNFGFVEIAIQRPGGEVVVYDPPLEHCVAPEMVTLSPEAPSAYASAYIGYAKGRGQIFDAPGRYRLRALYHALDGSRVVSPTIDLRVRAPLSQADEDAADLMLGDAQGMLLFVLGSDSEELAGGTRAFEQLLERHPQHPLAVYARMAAGFNAMRAFKLATPTGVRVRKADPEGAVEMLSATVQRAESVGLDNITINLATRRLARAQAAAGKRKEADKTLKDMVERFRRKSLKPHVLATIEAQAKATAAMF